MLVILRKQSGHTKGENAHLRLRARIARAGEKK